ncbi:MAG TPA: hypothetical protein VG299_03510, partial [Candidatus Dormibacteraeota bacterium]|nr:hypothetical protein [Candidatus Dormibacteraeota bacterium]
MAAEVPATAGTLSVPAGCRRRTQAYGTGVGVGGAGVGVGAGVDVGAGVAVGAGVRDADGDAVGDPDALGEADGLGVALLEGSADGVTCGIGPNLTAGTTLPIRGRSACGPPNGAFSLGDETTSTAATPTAASPVNPSGSTSDR